MCLGSILELGIGDIGEGVKAADMMVQFEVSGGDCQGVQLVLMDTECSKMVPKVTWVLDWNADMGDAGGGSEVAEDECDIEVVEEKSQESIVEEGVAEEGKIMVVLEWEMVVRFLMGASD